MALLSFALFSFQAQSAVESVALEPVPLDNAVDCHRILFRSSKHFKGTIFAVPRVLPGNGVYAATGLESTRIFNIMPSKNPGYYDLTVYLYFPANEEYAKSFRASLSQNDPAACNWDEAIRAINKDVADPAQQIKTISNIPLTSIEMRVPGFGKSGRVGSFGSAEEPSILEYYGKSISVHFEISEQERQTFESQVVSTGINASLKLNFQARSRTGSVSAKIDTENLTANFAAEVKAKGLKYLGEADVAAFLKSALQRTSIEIQGEGGTSNESIAKVTKLIVEKVFKEISLLPAEAETIKDVSPKESKGLVDIAAVVEILKTRVSGEISFEMFSASEVATAQTELYLQTDRLNDPHSAEVTVKAQYLDPSSGIFLNAGETMTIVPSYWYTDKIEYPEQKAYLTEHDLKTLKLSSSFSDLTNERMHIANKTINENVVAVGSWSPFPFPDQVRLPYSFRWLRVRRVATRYRMASGEIPTTFEALKELPVLLSFSKLGDRKLTRLSDLIEENEFWKAVYDAKSGRIILTAKVDLGTVRFRERFTGKDSIKVGSTPVILDEVYEIQKSPFGKTETRDHEILRADPKPILMQKAVVFNVGRPKKLTDK